MPEQIDSEFRIYPFIVDRLVELGWDKRSPDAGGQIYTQQEVLRHPKLKKALGRGRPEYTVDAGEGEFWVIEAKAKMQDLNKALRQAEGRAEKINRVKGVSCRIVTGIAGNPETTHFVKTRCLVEGTWKPLEINKRESTGFVSPAQVQKILNTGDGLLIDYEIDDKVFEEKIKEINEKLHNGGFHKKGRAEILACLLLALANDQHMKISDDPATLISDINTRAKGELEKYGKEAFFGEINIHLPISPANHTKNKRALTECIEILRDMNIASAINSGRDVLGQCYEQFLKYANDAKEIGIVLTPRHITNFGADVIDIQRQDTVLDPTCGTGGFLVAALDKVRRDGGDIDAFKRGNLFGIEQDPLIATLAIINMVFRGDGSSHIVEADYLASQKLFGQGSEHIPSKVLMNPPFALKQEFEWQFVDKALKGMQQGGLLFAVLPTSTMNAATDNRGEITWRREMLARHTLTAVCKLPLGLFYPQVAKGTYGVVIKAHRPHDLNKDKVVWTVLHDGVKRTKTQSLYDIKDNMENITRAIKRYVTDREQPRYLPEEVDCTLIDVATDLDLSPEHHIGSTDKKGKFNLAEVKKSNESGKRFLMKEDPHVVHECCSVFPVVKFFESYGRGKSGRMVDMGGGAICL